MKSLIGMKVKLKVSTDMYKGCDGKMIERSFYSIDDPTMCSLLEEARLHFPGSVHTTDFKPNRQNIAISADGIITKTWLG